MELYECEGVGRMNAIKSDVENLVQKELESANQRFPMFRSDHEGAAVILEEIEEVKGEMGNIIKEYDKSLNTLGFNVW